MKRLLPIALIVGVLGSGGVAAAELFEKEIKARKGYMQLYSYNIGVLGAMAKGKRPYDAEAAQTAADNLVAVTQMKNGALWPKGSHKANPEVGDRTRSLPEIWSTYPKIAEAGKAFKVAAKDMQGAAGGGLDALKAKMGALGKGCKGCHDDFRAKKKK
ncbi:MAG: cytochrome c [Gammaproteobacteria bacterium]|nr:cytochrome c [Gammaproteobacteria bacterium]